MQFHQQAIFVNWRRTVHIQLAVRVRIPADASIKIDYPALTDSCISYLTVEVKTIVRHTLEVFFTKFYTIKIFSMI
jgi:hypothetical protein